MNEFDGPTVVLRRVPVKDDSLAWKVQSRLLISSYVELNANFASARQS